MPNPNSLLAAARGESARTRAGCEAPPDRRRFLAAAAGVVSGVAFATAAAATGSGCRPAERRVPEAAGALDDPQAVVDLHQHTSYHGRSDEALVAHQRALGVTRTILLPAGSQGGLAAGCGGNESVLGIARAFPSEFSCFANEVPDLDAAVEVIEGYLKRGAIGIGEQKFPVECDSPAIEKIATLAREYDVPVLLHFQYEAYNRGFERFHRVLDRFPTVRFIGHAQTWWGHIDRRHQPEVLYPSGAVTAGGLTDRWLAEYPNLFADLSAGSGLNALLRDEEFTRGFLDRHQDKLLFGSDCADAVGRGEGCQGSQTLAAIRRLSPNAEATAKILSGNARRVLKLGP